METACGFKSRFRHHVAASYVSLAATFLQKVTGALMPSRLLFRFRKRPRWGRLLGCKRLRNGALSLPTFCGCAFGAGYLLCSVSSCSKNPVSGAFCFSLRNAFAQKQSALKSSLPAFLKFLRGPVYEAVRESGKDGTRINAGQKRWREQMKKVNGQGEARCACWMFG